MSSPLYRLKHKWTVKDFASTYLADSVDKATYPQLYSEWFASSLDCQTKFRLIVRPRGVNEKSANTLCLCLEMKRTGPFPLVKSADVKLKISLLNERKEECHSRELGRKFVYPSDNWSSETFLKHSVLVNPAKGLLPSDTLTLLVQITVFPAYGERGLTLEKLEMESIENARASLGRLLVSAEHRDVLLVVNKETLPAHMTLLSAGSPVFSGLFKVPEGDGTVRQVKMVNMKLPVAKGLLRFIYTGEVENGDLAEYAEELLMAADKYDVALLKALCCQFLCGQVNPENAFRLMAFADRHSVVQLKTATVEYIRAHLEDVCLTQKWTQAGPKVFFEELRQLKEKEDAQVMREERSTPEGASIVTEESSTLNGSLKYHLKYEWTVSDFAATYLGDSVDNYTYPRLNSEWFSSSRDSQVEFRLFLRPRGNNRKSQKGLGLYLEMKCSCPLAQSADVNFKFSLLNERKEKGHSREGRRKFVCPSANWGWTHFLAHSRLQEPANGFLPGDQLIILAELAVFPPPVIQQPNELLLAKLKVESIEKVRDCLAGLLDSDEHSDVVLEVEGSEIRAHKALLSLHSPVFSAMFTSEMSEGRDGKVMIPDMKEQVAKELLRFIYTGEVEDLEEDAEELLAL